MFEALSKLFGAAPAPDARIRPELAVAALLVHLAAVDGVTGPEETAAIKGALQDHFGLSEDDVDRLVREATRRDAESVDFYAFTTILSGLPLNERIEIVRMMWAVVFADSTVHELEDNVVWRIAELIGIDARTRTTIRAQMRS